jgi:hypothetical protein
LPEANYAFDVRGAARERLITERRVLKADHDALADAFPERTSS